MTPADGAPRAETREELRAVTFTVEVELVPDEPLEVQMDRWLMAFNSARHHRQCRLDVTETYPSPFTPEHCAIPPKPRQVPPHTVGGPASGHGP